LQALFGEIPIIVTLGNHDNREAFYEGWLGQAPNHMPYNTVTRIGNTTIIGLDISDKIQQNGLLTEAHCQWLEKALVDAEGTEILVMMHHHLVEEQATIPALPDAQPFYEIIERSKVVAVLCGHTHHAYIGEFAGKPYITAANLSFSGVDEGEGIVRFESNAGFNDCVLQEGKIKVKYIAAEADLRLLTRVKFR
ncbi:MAG: metallophosphoesterase family protein, partial [Cellulosilyticaceae bacterium]